MSEQAWVTVWSLRSIQIIVLKGGIYLMKDMIFSEIQECNRAISKITDLGVI